MVAMARESSEIVREAFEAQAEGGVEAMLPFVHDDFEMTTPPALASEPGTYRGHDGIRRWFSSFYEAVDDVRIEADEVEARGDSVAIAFRMTVRGRTTGLEAVQQAAGLCTVRDGKVHTLEFFADWSEALEAAGLEGKR